MPARKSQKPERGQERKVPDAYRCGSPPCRKWVGEIARAEGDPFCSMECARRAYGTSLPTSILGKRQRERLADEDAADLEDPPDGG